MDKFIIGECIDYTHDGKGVVKHDGFPIFVNNLLIGEKAKIQILNKQNNFYNGKVIELISVSKERVKPICENYKICGGCNLMHMSYAEQTKFKAVRVRELIKRTSKIDIDTPKIHIMDNPYRYRNKVQVPIGSTYKGEIVAGFYHPKSHQIINMDQCYIENEEADKIVNYTKKLLKKYSILPYENGNKGSIKYLIIRKSFKYNSILIVFVSKTDYIPRSNKVINELVQKFPNIETVVLNHNPKNTSVVLGDKEKILYGNGYIFDEINGIKFKISAHSFYQVNPKQTEILYRRAIELADLSKSDNILDAYCGVGTIGLSAVKYVNSLVGVEIVPSAIKDAKHNAEINSVKNATFCCEDATSFIYKEAKNKKVFDVMFFDPPRDGCSKEFIDSVLKMEPKKIIYISCDPATLARDIGILKVKYNLDAVECVDMFPNTYHVETITKLSLK